MAELVVEQIVSADGFAADAAGGMSFLTGSDPSQVDTDQLRMLESVSAIVLGRRTYELFAAFWPAVSAEQEPVAGPINRLPKHVISSTVERAPWGDSEIAVERGDGVDTVRRLRAHYGGDLIVWGSLQLTDALFRAGEVDVLRLRVVPSLVGAGRGPTPADLPLTTMRLSQGRVYDTGQVSLEYRDLRRASATT